MGLITRRIIAKITMADHSARAAYSKYLRLCGLVLVVLGFVQLALDMIVYTTVTTPEHGAWWGAIVAIIAGMMGLLSTTRFAKSGVIICVALISVFCCDFRAVVMGAFPVSVSLRSVSSL
jgi:hypothetical protein